MLIIWGVFRVKKVENHCISKFMCARTCVFVCMQIEITHIIIRERDPVIVKIQVIYTKNGVKIAVNLSVLLVNYYPGQGWRLQGPKHSWTHSHDPSDDEKALGTQAYGNDTCETHEGHTHTFNTTKHQIYTGNNHRYTHQAEILPNTALRTRTTASAGLFLYIYIYLCIYIDLCLYKYQLKGFEELQVHFHEQYLKISGKQKWTLTKTIPFHIQIHQCIFPLHKHFFDTNVEIHKSPKSRDRKRQEPEAFPSLAWRKRKRTRDLTDR